MFYHGNVPPGEGEISEARTYFGQSKIDLQVEGYLHLATGSTPNGLQVGGKGRYV